ncbi:L-lactate dehydrogenase complex protein LldE [Nitrosomonas marina]|uniref:L-lactate dehydrogenase complex protein LldE n=1 Tax=Nitrosomonas marina TaxID=917 RepID=A0A1I0EYI8_9PROT|nr:(Fe-S)-binding protein [Nitrosomonas marina]SET50576.1 L-lactate dehydrogenase complex protein LldE [Nitrosomonas marina]
MIKTESRMDFTRASAGPKPDTVYLFGTCLIDLLYPQAGVSAVHLFEREGVNVIFPQTQTCCGQPAWNSGYRDEALAVARAQLKLFPRPIPIIVPSASCAGMIKVHYPALFKDEPDEASVFDVVNRVYELTEFLTDILKVNLTDLGEPTTVAVHSSCTARREMNVADRIDSLLDQLQNVTRIEPDNAEECCGFGGTFAIKQPEISTAMVLEKAKAIENTGAQQLIGQDCGCLMNIGGALKKQDSQISHVHIAEFLWDRTHKAKP